MSEQLVAEGEPEGASGPLWEEMSRVVELAGEMGPGRWYEVPVDCDRLNDNLPPEVSSLLALDGESRPVTQVRMDQGAKGRMESGFICLQLDAGALGLRFMSQTESGARTAPSGSGYGQPLEIQFVGQRSEGATDNPEVFVERERELNEAGRAAEREDLLRRTLSAVEGAARKPEPAA